MAQGTRKQVLPKLRTVVCLRCPNDVALDGHALGCPNTRRAPSDADLATSMIAEALIRKGIVR